MKRTILALLTLFALVLGSSVPGDAFRGGGGGHSGGGNFSGHIEGGHFGGSHSGGGHFSGHMEGRGGGGHFGGGRFEGRHFHGHGDHFGVGFVFDPFGPWWWDPWPYYYPYQPSPVVVQSAPESYLEPQVPEEHYWYYCSDPSGYYPYLKKCPKGWMKVVPAPTPSGPEE